MRVLDLFCGVGMAADGYAQAGFAPTGVDVNLRVKVGYPYPFVWLDALAVLQDRDFVSQFDLIHASPPCQAHTRAKHLRNAQGGKSKAIDFLTPMDADLEPLFDSDYGWEAESSASNTYLLEMLRTYDIPWVVENVVGAPGMEKAVVECGSAYGLKVRRHRLFLASFPLVGSGCFHEEQGKPVGVYHVMGDTCKGVCSKTGKLVIGGSTAKTVEEGREAMGVDRDMSWEELKEGFPPAYTRHIGEQAMAYIKQKGG